MLTQEMINEDFAAWNRRMKTASKKLSALPMGRLPYADHKKREMARKKYQCEIKHIRGLFQIALDGLKNDDFEIPAIGGDA